MPKALDTFINPSTCPKKGLRRSKKIKAYLFGPNGTAGMLFF